MTSLRDQPMENKQAINCKIFLDKILRKHFGLKESLKKKSIKPYKTKIWK